MTLVTVIDLDFFVPTFNFFTPGSTQDITDKRKQKKAVISWMYDTEHWCKTLVIGTLDFLGLRHDIVRCTKWFTKSCPAIKNQRYIYIYISETEIITIKMCGRVSLYFMIRNHKPFSPHGGTIEFLTLELWLEVDDFVSDATSDIRASDFSFE